MLKKALGFKLKLIGFIGVSFLLVHLISAYFFGFIAKNELQLQFRQITDLPFVQVIKHEYRQGFFTSTEVDELAINSKLVGNVLKVLKSKNSTTQANIESDNGVSLESSTTYSIKYVTTIKHGFFSGILNGHFVPTIAYAKTSILYPESLQKVLNKFFDKKEPLIIENVIYLNKAGKYEAYSPEFNYDEALSGVKVLWEGMKLKVNYNSKFNAFTTQLNVPLFKLIVPNKGRVELNNVSYSANSRYSPNKIKVGETKLNTDLLTLQWQDKIPLGFKVGEALHLLTGISLAEFLNGIDAIEPNDFSFKKVSYLTSSYEENGYFNASANIAFESLATNNINYGPMSLKLNVNHVLASEFSKLLDKLKDYSNSQVNSTSQAESSYLVPTIKKYFAPILNDTPKLSLEGFSLKVPSGLVKISGMITTHGFQVNDLDNESQFMKNLVIDFNFSVPKPTLSYLFILQMKYLLSAGNAQMDAKSSEAISKVVKILLDNQINTWVKKGYVKENSGKLETNFLMQDGKLYLNHVQTNVEP